MYPVTIIARYRFHVGKTTSVLSSTPTEVTIGRGTSEGTVTLNTVNTLISSGDADDRGERRRRLHDDR